MNGGTDVAPSARRCRCSAPSLVRLGSGTAAHRRPRLGGGACVGRALLRFRCTTNRGGSRLLRRPKRRRAPSMAPVSAHYPVGYSTFLSGFYRVLGASHAVAGFANALVGAALAVVTWQLARYALSPARARLAGCIVALHPGLILQAALVMSEPLAALLTLSSFLLAVRDPRPRRGLVAGALALGVAALVRPQALLCAPFLAVSIRGGARRFVAAAAACAVALLPVLLMDFAQLPCDGQGARSSARTPVGTWRSVRFSRFWSLPRRSVRATAAARSPARWSRTAAGSTAVASRANRLPVHGTGCRSCRKPGSATRSITNRSPSRPACTRRVRLRGPTTRRATRPSASRRSLTACCCSRQPRPEALRFRSVCGGDPHGSRAPCSPSQESSDSSRLAFDSPTVSTAVGGIAGGRAVASSPGIQPRRRRPCFLLRHSSATTIVTHASLLR